MPLATAARQLIRDYLAGWRQFSDSAQLVGAFGTVRQWEDLTSSTLPVPPVAAQNIAGDAKHPQSKISPSQEWSENVTDLVTTNTTQAVETPKSFELLAVRPLHEEFLMRKARLEEDTKWIELYKQRLDELSGGAESFTLDGVEIATYKRNGNLNTKRLEAEQPEVMSRFTRLVTELKFDKAAFEKEEPELFAAYRTKVFRLPGARGIKTL